MKSYIKKLLTYWEVKKQQKEEIDLFLKTYHLKLVKVKETSIILSCIQPLPSGKKNKYNLVREKDGFIIDRDLTPSEFAKKVKEYRNAATKRKIPFEQYLDDLAENIKRVKLRKAALARWIEKFELKFHKHFDGEIVVGKASRRDGTPTLWLQGAHNHTINGEVINIKTIRDPNVVKYSDLPDDVPFKANVEYIFSNRVIPKKNTSSFFPKNWDITRIKEEIALVYDQMKKSGIDFKYPNNKFFALNSSGDFEILIEFDNLGNLTNAYPKIN